MRASVGEHVGAGRVALLESRWQLLAPSHIPCPMHLFLLAVLELYISFYNELVDVSKLFS